MVLPLLLLAIVGHALAPDWNPVHFWMHFLGTP
jgi:hypothetical protein